MSIYEYHDLRMTETKEGRLEFCFLFLWFLGWSLDCWLEELAYRKKEVKERLSIC